MGNDQNIIQKDMKKRQNRSLASGGLQDILFQGVIVFSTWLQSSAKLVYRSCPSRVCGWRCCWLLSRFSRVRLCATPQTAAHQAPPSLGFSRQERWSGLPFPSPMHESEKSLSRVRLLATPWTAAHQAPPSMWFSRQEYRSGVPLPSPVVDVDAPKGTEDRAEYMKPKMNNIKKQKRRKSTEKLFYLTELWCAVEYNSWFRLFQSW